MRSRAKQGNRKQRRKLYRIDPETGERRVLKNKYGTPITIGIPMRRGGSMRAVRRENIRRMTHERENLLNHGAAAVQSMGNFAAHHRTREANRGS